MNKITQGFCKVGWAMAYLIFVPIAVFALIIPMPGDSLPEVVGLGVAIITETAIVHVYILSARSLQRARRLLVLAFSCAFIGIPSVYCFYSISSDDYFVASLVVGGLITCCATYISNWLSGKRGGLETPSRSVRS